MLFYFKVIRSSSFREEDPGTAFTPEQTQTWQAQASRFLKRKLGASDQKQLRVPITKRLVAHKHITRFDNALSCTFDGGLSLFSTQPGDDDKPIHQLPLLVSCEDRGSSNDAAKWFRLFHLRLREKAYDDPWHDLWNAVKKAAGYKQLLGVMKLFAVNHSVAHGPWESSSAFAEIRDSALELKAVTKPGDALLASRMLGILWDKGDFRGGHRRLAARAPRWPR